MGEERSEDEKFRTLSGFDVDPVYGPEDGVGDAYLEKLGLPGKPPFTRGVYKNMYRGRLWTMRQYSGFGTAKETNRRFQELLSRGQTGLSMAFDLPTQMGYDPDAKMARGEVGRAGVSIASVEDMDRVFLDIPLDDVSTSMTINATAPILVGLYAAVARKRDIPLTQLRGTVQNDILKEYIARGTYIYPPEPSMRLTVDLMEFCSREIPRWNSISVSGYHMREKGATAPQEVAFTLANGIEYLRQARQRDLDVVEIARRVSFFFSAHSDFFEEIAKFRAARRMWSRLLREEFDVSDPDARRLRFHTQTAGVSLTAQQPENNIARVAYQAMSAVLGGTQSLHTNAMDEALGLPTERTATIALRTQQILGHETGVARTVDPLAGSYFLENLTDRVENRAMEIYNEVQDFGGAMMAVENGFVRDEIEKSAQDEQEKIEEGERKIVGVNCYREEEEVEPDIQEIEKRLEERRREKIRKLKENRNEHSVGKSLKNLHRAASSDENLLPPIITCLENRATLGEVSDELRDVFGEHRN